MPTVERPGGSKKEVKNLGWLLANWKLVSRITVKKHSPTFPHTDALLVVDMDDGRIFTCDFASSSLLLRFLHRPVFIGMTIHWFGQSLLLDRDTDVQWIVPVPDSNHHIEIRTHRFCDAWYCSVGRTHLALYETMSSPFQRKIDALAEAEGHRKEIENGTHELCTR